MILDTSSNNWLLDTDWFDDNFWTFFTENNELIKKFNTQNYRIPSTQISPRVLTHWQKYGIIDDMRQDLKGWRKFCFSELVWLQCVLELRKFGMHLDKIKKVKNRIDMHRHEGIASLFPELDFFLAYGLSTKHPVKLLVLSTGESLIGRQRSIDQSKQIGVLKDNYISIDLNAIVNNLRKDTKYEIDYLEYSKTEIEKEIFDSIYLKEVKEISIRLTNEEYILIEKESIKNSRAEVESLLSKVSYGQSKTVKRKGKIHHIFQEKKKLKK